MRAKKSNNFLHCDVFFWREGATALSERHDENGIIFNFGTEKYAYENPHSEYEGPFCIEKMGITGGYFKRTL